MNASRTGLAGAFLVLASLGWGAEPLASQQPTRVPLSLAQAEQAAVEANPEAQAARHRTRAATSAAAAAGAFRWPGVEARAGVMGTDDPVGAFGTRLRQGRFTEADFAVERLNDPAAVEDWTAGVGAEWAIADGARWAEWSAARAEATAADAQLRRGLEAVRHHARMLYVDLLRARGQHTARQAAQEAAAATLDRVERRRGEGMATEADVLQARAALAGATAHRVAAELASADAADLLAAHLGWAPGVVPEPTTSLDEALRGGEPAPPPAAGTLARADLRASELAVESARQRVRAASAARWPRASVFTEVGSHAAGFTATRSTHWTAGLQVSVPLFTGFGLQRAAEASRSAAEAAQASHEGRVRDAAREVAAAQRGVEAAELSREAARAGADAAAEAARLLGRRYEEGMTTLAELLGAEADAARLAAAAVDADARLVAARATLEFAVGSTGPDSNDGDGR